MTTTDDSAFVLTHDGQFQTFQISKQADRVTADAVASGFPHHLVVETIDDLSPIFGPQLVGLYNALRDPKSPAVNRFATARDARKRVFARLHLSAFNSDATTVTTGSEPAKPVAATETKEATMATKSKKAVKKAVAKKSTKKTVKAKSTAPRGKGKPAGKLADFTQVREGTTRAKILKEMTGTKSAEQIGTKLGIASSLVSSNVYCLWRDCAIGYSYGPKGELTALFPGSKKYEDAIKKPSK